MSEILEHVPQGIPRAQQRRQVRFHESNQEIDINDNNDA